MQVTGISDAMEDGGAQSSELVDAEFGSHE